jgi:hypothetical protein
MSELEPLHMSALRWKDSPSSADIPEQTTIKIAPNGREAVRPYVISGIRGVTGGERPEVFELMCSLRATESESTRSAERK